MARRNLEGPIQVAICQYLGTVLDPAVGYWFSIPNENDGSGRMNARLNDQGRKKGVADLCIVAKGNAHFIEVKASKAYQTPDQKDFAAAVSICGAWYGVARSVDDVAALLVDWGIPTRARMIQHQGSIR